MEKREHARYPRTFEMTGCENGEGIPARMVATNLSLGGLYCTSNVCFDEMTRIAVTLMLPLGRASETEPITAEAVVVRHRQVQSTTGDDRFELALFFTDLAEDARGRLERYLNR